MTAPRTTHPAVVLDRPSRNRAPGGERRNETGDDERVATGGAWIPSPWSMLRASHGGARPRPETLRAPMAGPSTRAGQDDLV
eukprot:CAMPEP_0168290462 /NCGR_PEP_ID=MMETSP0142_2-20121227/5351_1 /TAXON_ID=44445 /ORGANISM="Pseudo-nitzschia australis, Strain 10249 10 AB" /LENGTH=81 /DNA_ID=CAMNT_0008237539 /DNA_START=37 /DNA_END=281 /DNA_ORIENTATION=+